MKTWQMGHSAFVDQLFFDWVTNLNRRAEDTGGPILIFWKDLRIDWIKEKVNLCRFWLLTHSKYLSNYLLKASQNKKGQNSSVILRAVRRIGPRTPNIFVSAYEFFNQKSEWVSTKFLYNFISWSFFSSKLFGYEIRGNK